jgi:hypothetical protein
MTMEGGGRGRSARVGGGIAAALLLLLAACLAALPRGAHAQNNFFGMSDDLATPPTVRLAAKLVSKKTHTNGPGPRFPL